MQISVTKSSDQVHARLNGLLEISDVAQAKDHLRQILLAGGSTTFDFSSLTEIDTSGVQLVLALHNQAVRENRTCRFVHPTEDVLNAFRLLSLDWIFDQSIATH